MTTQNLQPTVLDGAFNQTTLLVNGIMNTERSLIVWWIMRHLLLAKLIGTFNNRTAVGNVMIISEIKYPLAISARFLSAKHA